jgi:hypothetical protein
LTHHFKPLGTLHYMMFLFYALLFVPCLFPAQAVLTRRISRIGKPVNIVAGTGMLDPAEVAGQAPLFVDAFYDHEKSVAHVVLNMKSFLTSPTNTDLREWGPETEWSCTWSDPQAKLAKSAAVVRGFTNLDTHPGPQTIVEADARDHTTTPAPHWALVLSCPTIPALNGSSTARLNVRALRDGKWVYNRYGVPVSESRFVKRGVESALCTMVAKDPLTTQEYLKPWAQYHLNAGFTQLLVYVEEKDTSWVEDALRSFVKKDRVAIVPFYFGNISDQKAFIMQGAMENHCLYQARGMAKWIAHIDVDEYFDFLQKGVDMRNYKFPKSDSSDIAIVVRNQFWGIERSSHRVNAPYPCHLNAKSTYIHEPGWRSKLIMRPEHIDALFPHYALKQDGYTEVHPDPSTELRLNHFKWCDLSGHGCFGTEQSRTSRRKKLATDDGGWKQRCSRLLAEEQ